MLGDLMNEKRIITIGVFDGVHLGHQAIVRQGAAIARERGLSLRALTFDPHPAAVLRPEATPPRLMALDDRMAALRETGADEVRVLEPTRELLALEPRAFAQWLVKEHAPAAVVEGHDFRFGRDRAGDMNMLRTLGDELGFDVTEVATQEFVTEDYLVAPARSSLARWLLGCGRVADAARCMGRMYAMRGRVIEGDKRGRTIGVPTANLDPVDLAEVMVPADGVYACLVDTPAHGQLPGAVSIGTKPTFGGQTLTVEAHLLDFDEDLYEKVITIRFARWLRGQQPFPGIEALGRQLARDVSRTRRWHEDGLIAC